MSKEEAEDMRPEYDFSQATRGKHSARLAVAPGEEPPSWYLSAAQFDRQAWLGEALRQAQELESLLFAGLVLVLKKDPAAAGRNLPSILEEPGQAGLRELLDGLAAQSPNLQSRLIEALGERAWLVHRSLQSEEPEPTLESLTTITSRLQELSKRISSLKDEMLRSMEARLVGDSMSPAEFQERKSAAIRAWLAA